ncbi:hypothetical protein RI129_004324 [Pyrocoelia pectoralis]|uniref:SURF1-like protein n=1 Tax=Pyrocoelia pectoralis TaxID=417401 RepID=A0AAN7ZGP9_9COLE
MFSILRFSESNLKFCRGIFEIIRNRSYKYSTTFTINQKLPVGPFGWFLLVIPGSTFALGTWQIQRKRWKDDLVVELQKRTNSATIELPESIEEVNSLEFCPVHVRGQFDHSREIYLGPRSLLVHGDSTNSSSLFTIQNSAYGYLVVTPFKLENRKETILVNRGWVSKEHKDPRTRQVGQIEGVVDVVGVVRLHENRAPFIPSNKPNTNVWYYRDLHEMCYVTGADPISLDLISDCNIKGGPIGGQTRIALRNEHLSYIITWYSLSMLTGFMWFSYFVKGVKL